MNESTKRKIVFYLASIFVVGAVSGAAFGWGIGRQKRFEQKGKTPRTMGEVCDYMKKRFQDKLGLTSDQMKKVEPILDDAGRQMHKIHCHSVREIESVIEKQNAEIAKLLTPEQQLKLEEMNRDRREFQKKRFPAPPVSPAEEFDE